MAIVKGAGLVMKAIIEVRSVLSLLFIAFDFSHGADDLSRMFSIYLFI